jgi:PHD/YefM family antitoxin component YafN of YafNO toxin-antitoxin module
MQTFNALELQQRAGDIQRASSQGPVLLTNDGKPSRVILCAEEFARLKRAAGEPVPPEILTRRARTVRSANDPLGYDTTDPAGSAGRMIDDVSTGRTQAAMQAELSQVRAAWVRTRV